MCSLLIFKVPLSLSTSVSDAIKLSIFAGWHERNVQTEIII